MLGVMRRTRGNRLAGRLWRFTKWAVGWPLAFFGLVGFSETLNSWDAFFSKLLAQVGAIMTDPRAEYLAAKAVAVATFLNHTPIRVALVIVGVGVLIWPIATAALARIGQRNFSHGCAARKSAITIISLVRICSATRKRRHGGKITAASERRANAQDRVAGDEAETVSRFHGILAKEKGSMNAVASFCLHGNSAFPRAFARIFAVIHRRKTKQDALERRVRELTQRVQHLESIHLMEIRPR